MADGYRGKLTTGICYLLSMIHPHPHAQGQAQAQAPGSQTPTQARQSLSSKVEAGRWKLEVQKMVGTYTTLRAFYVQ